MNMRHNYLNNKDILKEIAKSKNTFCSYLEELDNEYDIILPELKKINKTNIMAGRRARAERLAKKAHEIQVKAGNKVKLAEFAINVRDIPATDVVFRVTTWDHVPKEVIKRKPKNNKEVGLKMENIEGELQINPDETDLTTKYVRLKFPPFYHYKVDENGVPFIVGKSHWEGGLDNGWFSQEHGKMTNTLARMFMKLVERYATRSNWRGYTYNDEMRSTALLQLSQIGLQFDESKSANPFAYYTAAVTNSFTRVLLNEKKGQNLRDDILEANGLNPSYTRQAANEWGSASSMEARGEKPLVPLSKMKRNPQVKKPAAKPKAKTK